MASTTPKIKLWYIPGACSLAPHIILKETGLDFELVKMTFNTLNNEYKEINPKLRIPALAINDDIITENPAVMMAISNLVPEKHLFGKTPLDTVRVVEWANYISGTLHGQAFAGLWRPQRFTADPEDHHKLQAMGMTAIKESFRYIEDKLNSVHAVGDSYTIVDAYLLNMYRWGRAVHLPMESDYPKLTALVAEVSKRPATVAATEAEGLSPIFS
ncbi:glutathione S-transferase [Nannizzia gypsea CBS 118893]|uniref:Glutathione S-transferase n=1 Tax=Arthroderma gypseum (strain ATCC MYA-4604 / CBS 118893) TaxID=535722 RepID=E4UYH0_ARTGP|nr:glutathione S-transferase [Nannizzia gypsea CBS 118893]EFR02133.1 glutathione S-transferase [Nannizzia gypsea CBS 118893]